MATKGMGMETCPINSKITAFKDRFKSEGKMLTDSAILEQTLLSHVWELKILSGKGKDVI
jgi:hypothetical protein